MNVSWKAPLGPGQTSHPVLHVERVLLPPGVPRVDDDVLARIFSGTGNQLKTWGRTKGTRLDDPHWIGVRGPTPLHRDPAYPRYSHHLVLRADDQWIRGLDRKLTHLRRGTFFILDGHSPHQLGHGPRDKALPPTWYLACSLDTADRPLAPVDAIARCLAYVLANPIDNRTEAERAR